MAGTTKDNAMKAARKAARKITAQGGSPDERRRIAAAVNAGIDAMAAQWPKAAAPKKTRTLEDD